MFVSGDSNEIKSLSVLYPFIPSSLSSNPDFQYLRSKVESFSSTSQSMSPIYLTLNRLLTEVSFTFSESLQKQMLLKIRNWYHSKVPETKREVPIYPEQKLEKSAENLELMQKSSISPKVPYIPRKYFSNGKKKTRTEDELKTSPNETLNTRASSSEPSQVARRRRMSQSPGIIKCIVNNFVKNKRIKMYNFTLEAFLDGNKVASPQKKRHRPLSSMMKKQINELHGIKRKLSNQGVTCEMNELYHGYVLDDRDHHEGFAFPSGGERLIRKNWKSKKN